MAMKGTAYDDRLYKLLIIGDSGVGKTCLLLRFCNDAFTHDIHATMGVDFKTKTVEIYGRRIKLQIWDTAGQERFSDITTAYFRRAMGIVMVYDVTDLTSVENLSLRWLPNVEKYASSDVKKILIGNKCDLLEEKMISLERAQALAEELGIEHFEASSKTRLNVETAFLTLVRDITNNIDLQSLKDEHTPNHMKLIIYSQLGYFAEVKEMVEKGADPNTPDDGGWTPLLGACCNGHVDIVNYLIEKENCDLSVFRDHAMLSGDQPILHLFISWGHLSVVRCLIEKQHIHPHCIDSYGSTILHVSAKYGYLHFIEFILEKMNFHPDHTDVYGQSPIFYAIREGHLSVVKCLIEKGANINLKDKRSQTPLHVAVSEQQFTISYYLMEHRIVDINCEDVDGNTSLLLACQCGEFGLAMHLIDDYQVNPDSKDSFGKTPLLWACQWGKLKVAKRLIEDYKLNPICRDENGMTPLHWSCIHEELIKGQFMEYLFQNFSIYCDPQDNEGWTPLLYACSNGFFSAAIVLLEKNADPNSRDKDGLVPLHWACHGNDETLVKYLVEKCQVDLNCKDKNKRTPLHHACRYGKDTIVKYLVQECHIDPNCGDKDGWTPLHWACKEEKIDIVDYLMGEQVVDPNCTDSDGWTPLHYACRLIYHKKVVACLVERADVNAATPDGCVPLDMTQSSDIVRLLLKHGATPNYQQAEKCIPHDVLKDQISMAIKIFVFGNPGGGKSTLTKSLLVNAKTILSRFVHYFFQVRGITKNTAGIIPHDIHSSQFGSITIYDCAGHKEYYAGHSAVLSNSMAEFPSIVLLVADMREANKCFMETLQYWLQFINVHIDEASKSHLVIVGTHADQCRNLEEKMRLIGSVTSSLTLNGIILKGSIAIDCRYANSAAMTKLRALLADSCRCLRISEQMSLTDHCFLVFLLDKFKDIPAVTIHTVDEKIDELSNMEVHWSFMRFHNLFEICERLNKRGNILFIKNDMSPENSWIVIDKAVLLSLVNGVLFAPKEFKQHVNIDSSTGVVSQSTLISLFPSVDINLISEFLCHLKFCQEITSYDVLSSLQAESTLLPHAHDRFFLFPDFVNCDAPYDTLQPDAQFNYHSGWVLQCMQDVTSRFKQVLLLRLAFKFALVRNVNCKLWRNGVSWLDRSGARAIVEMVNEKLVIVQTYSLDRVALVQLRSSVIREVLKVKEELCNKILVNELLVLPEDAKSYPLDVTRITAVTLTEVAQAIAEEEPHAILNARTFINLKELLIFEPYANLDQAIIQELFSNDDQKCIKDIDNTLLQRIASKACGQLDDFTIALNPSRLQLDSINSQASPAHQLLQILQLWKKEQMESSKRSTWSLGNLLDQFSIFAGRNPLAIAAGGFLSVGVPFRQNPVDIQDESDDHSIREIDSKSSPTLEQLQVLKGHGEQVKIISEAAYQWEKLAIAMGLNYPDTEKIKLDTNGAEKACLNVFILWLGRNTPKPISWEQLLECLQDCSLTSLAEKIRRVAKLN